MSVSLLKMQVSVHEISFILQSPEICSHSSHESSGSKVAYSQTIGFLGSILRNLLSSIF